MTFVDVQVEAIIDRPRSVVAAYAAAPANVPSWYANIDRVRALTGPPLAVGARFEFSAAFLGRTLTYTYEIVELVPDQRLVMRTAQGPFPMQTTYEWSDAPNGATRMTLRNLGEPKGFFGVAAPVLRLAMRRATTADLRRLKSILESDGGG
ncbi:ATPase [Mycobacterium sp. CBMA293]|uniref:SRPBCC family protein n=1 Tax=unclassified Mycolicibacterium TaxID=2636767 RepID=UPI001329B59A|nr:MULTISPECIES: SRPBCC family protein [unclassified Mycolicibacterium]MUL46638.1 ATPase [Mycolicibacterium sp. CBMA 360]MUL94419.1 ATPase [Mycolicibacterium sp. CBMA 230]MUM30958.1 ATPase [Mycolicibacterium sp. CBMA 361]MUL59061.1 ATPase [Mycolicibacterium sp. CBMA 335]MUL69455.1 ATPase [Mycolicibacterium sp. CBMA 311]